MKPQRDVVATRIPILEALRLSFMLNTCCCVGRLIGEYPVVAFRGMPIGQVDLSARERFRWDWERNRWALITREARFIANKSCESALRRWWISVWLNFWKKNYWPRIGVAPIQNNSGKYASISSRKDLRRTGRTPKKAKREKTRWIYSSLVPIDRSVLARDWIIASARGQSKRSDECSSYLRHKWLNPIKSS